MSTFAFICKCSTLQLQQLLSYLRSTQQFSSPNTCQHYHAPQATNAILLWDFEWKSKMERDFFGTRNFKKNVRILLKEHATIAFPTPSKPRLLKVRWAELLQLKLWETERPKRKTLNARSLLGFRTKHTLNRVRRANWARSGKTKGTFSKETKRSPNRWPHLGSQVELHHWQNKQTRKMSLHTMDLRRTARFSEEWDRRNSHPPHLCLNTSMSVSPSL